MKNKFKLDEIELAKIQLEERNNTERRTCKKCGYEGLAKNFYGRIIKHIDYLQVSFLSTCRECYSKENVSQVKKAKINKDYRRACTYWSRSKKRNIKSNLKLYDIRMLLHSMCYYCESSDIQIVLDRKDSSGGYTKDNVVPCCVRCNLIKSDMPYEAWKRLIPAVKNISKLGLFGSWKLTQNS